MVSDRSYKAENLSFDPLENLPNQRQRNTSIIEVKDQFVVLLKQISDISSSARDDCEKIQVKKKTGGKNQIVFE